MPVCLCFATHWQDWPRYHRPALWFHLSHRAYDAGVREGAAAERGGVVRSVRNHSVIDVITITDMLVPLGKSGVSDVIMSVVDIPYVRAAVRMRPAPRQ